MCRKPAISHQLPAINGQRSFAGLQQGFAIVTAIFLLVILAALGAFMLTFSASQQTAAATDIQGARAYQAARTGAEWVMYQVLDLDPVNANFPGAGAMAPCPAGSFPSAAFNGTALAGFTTVVACNRTTYTEGVKNVAVYAVTATASYGTPGAADYVERQVSVTASKCKDPNAAAPEFACS